MTAYTTEEKREALEISIKAMVKERRDIMDIRPLNQHDREEMQRWYGKYGQSILILQSILSDLTDDAKTKEVKE